MKPLPLETNHHCSSPRLFWGSGAWGAAASWLIYKPFISRFEQFGETYSYHVKEVWTCWRKEPFSSTLLECQCDAHWKEVDQKIKDCSRSRKAPRSHAQHRWHKALIFLLEVKLINNFYLKFQKISRNSISIRLSYHTLQVTSFVFIHFICVNPFIQVWF